VLAEAVQAAVAMRALLEAWVRGALGKQACCWCCCCGRSARARTWWRTREVTALKAASQPALEKEEVVMLDVSVCVLSTYV